MNFSCLIEQMTMGRYWENGSFMTVMSILSMTLLMLLKSNLIKTIYKNKKGQFYKTIP